MVLSKHSCCVWCAVKTPRWSLQSTMPGFSLCCTFPLWCLFLCPGCSLAFQGSALPPPLALPGSPSLHRGPESLQAVSWTDMGFLLTISASQSSHPFVTHVQCLDNTGFMTVVWVSGCLRSTGFWLGQQCFSSPLRALGADGAPARACCSSSLSTFSVSPEPWEPCCMQ